TCSYTADVVTACAARGQPAASNSRNRAIPATPGERLALAHTLPKEPDRPLHGHVPFAAFRRRALLVLSRKPGEQVGLGGGIAWPVVEVHGNRVRFGIEAPEQVRILRAELAGWQGPPVPDPELEGQPPARGGGAPERLPSTSPASCGQRG